MKFRGLTPWPFAAALAMLHVQIGRTRLVLERAARHSGPLVIER